MTKTFNWKWLRAFLLSFNVVEWFGISQKNKTICFT